MKHIKIYEDFDFVSIKNSFEKELSKYLKKSYVNDFKNIDNKNIDNQLIFLLDDDYGCRISDIYYLYQFDEYIVELSSIKINNSNGDRKFVHVKLTQSYFAHNSCSIEEFVKNFVKKLKLQDIIRKKQKYNREFNKDIKKYKL